MNSEGFWYYFKIVLSKTGYLKDEKMYSAYISAYCYYLSNDEIESWDRFEIICSNKGYKPDKWIKDTFNTLLKNRMDLENAFSAIFRTALREDKISML